MFLLRLSGLCLLLLLPVIVSANKDAKPVAKPVTKPVQSHRSKTLEASSRSSERGQSYKAQADLQNIINKHLFGPMQNTQDISAVKEERPKGKLQTIGVIFGDIIGVLVAEISRMFSSVVSDIAREVTAHGFANVFKQFLEFTRFGNAHASRASDNQPNNVPFSVPFSG